MQPLDSDSEWFLSHAPKVWVSKLPTDRATAIKLAASVVGLILPEWEAARPNDTVPPRAVAAALLNPNGDDENLRRHAKALAKGCSESRHRSLGYEHRIAEAARSLANAAAAASDKTALDEVAESLAKVEEHLLYCLACAGVYNKEREVRGKMFLQIVETYSQIA